RENGTNGNNGTNGKILENFRLFRYFRLFRFLSSAIRNHLSAIHLKPSPHGSSILMALTNNICALT
ncbi:MAG: hypothetical protein MOB07_04060, partial [Acidobacteria bacterium]|nr:hypothetical protein [Acidobacteriota bacterium]